MYGARGMADAVRDHLAAHFAEALTRLEAELGPVTNPDVPDESQFDVSPMPKLLASVQLATNGIGLDDWPFVMVVPGRMRRQWRENVDPDGTSWYHREYEVAVFCWARGDGWHLTAALRDRMVLAASDILMRAHEFGTDGRYRAHDDVTEQYSDVSVAPDNELGSTVAAGRVNLIVDGTEPLRPTLPTDADPVTSVRVTAVPDTLGSADTPPGGGVVHPALG